MPEINMPHQIFFLSFSVELFAIILHATYQSFYSVSALRVTFRVYFVLVIGIFAVSQCMSTNYTSGTLGERERERMRQEFVVYEIFC